MARWEGQAVDLGLRLGLGLGVRAGVRVRVTGRVGCRVKVSVTETLHRVFVKYVWLAIRDPLEQLVIRRRLEGSQLPERALRPHRYL